MKRSRACLLALATACLVACSQTPSIPSIAVESALALGPWAGQYSLPPEPLGPGCFQPAEESFGRELREACRRCASVEFIMENTAQSFRRRVKRADVENALDALAQIDQWLVRRTPEGMCVYPSNCPCVRFLDARGQEIRALHYYPAADGFVKVPESTWARCCPQLAACTKGVGGYLSVWDIFATWLPPASARA